MSKYQSTTTSVIGDHTYTFYDFQGLSGKYDITRLPYSLKILLENLLRHAGEDFVQDRDIETVAGWDPQATPSEEISFVPARVLLQDFTGVPAVVDLAAMRDAMGELGGSPDRINPLSAVDLVIDHSVMVDFYGHEDSLKKNTALEVTRNRERYQFLRWGQKAFENFKVVPPGTGICHQVNLEYLAQAVYSKTINGKLVAYPDTLVGTDSHTTMINGLGVLGWGVGGIEAEAAMLGQPISMLLPQVVGFKLTGKLPEGATATDLVLTVTEQLRKHGVVSKFVEFFGPGLESLSLADRATIGNMTPEYGATCAIFPVDRETINYLKLTGRSDQQLALVETYTKTVGIWHDENTPDAEYSSLLELDLADVVPSLAGPKRPQDRVPLSTMADHYRKLLEDAAAARTDEIQALKMDNEGAAMEEPEDSVHEISYRNENFQLHDGAVVIAAITSCTNTSNPSVMLAAGLLARKARQRGLTVKPWVKTSLAPGSKVVTEYLERSGLLEDLEAMGFYLVGYGCTTCIGNSGPLPDEIAESIRSRNLTVASVLSGNRNFEGRIHSDVKTNYLASPPLVVAYALAGSMLLDLKNEPLGEDAEGRAVYLKDIWPSSQEIRSLVDTHVAAGLFREKYADVYSGDEEWQNLPVSGGELYSWPESTYVRKPPFFENMTAEPPVIKPIKQARCLLKLGDSITTDHISPAGSIAKDSPAGHYLIEQGVEPKDFNSYGSRRGNHEVMMRGTFANVRLRNQLAPGTEGGWTTYFPENASISVYDAAMKYRQTGTPLVVLAGQEYGTGSSRDWAAKGTILLGVWAVIAKSFERIHRSNLVGMGVLPLQFSDGEDADSLGLDGTEQFDIPAVEAGQRELSVTATGENGTRTFSVTVRIDTPNEFDYFRNGGILHYVLRKLTGTQ
ncbi:aconitate hydratase AcnA [Porticoccus sp.]|uniref:aconitate hydratase AcnA n=1 Tax=Porticoccus sp. TaxID=2024853 RepID=UPI003F6A5342